MKTKNQKVMTSKLEKLSIAFALAFTVTSCCNDDNGNPNTPPVASEARIEGELIVGQELTARAKGDDEDGDDVTLKYQWYRADDNKGAGEQAIPEATMNQYTLVSDDEGKYITVGVTPNDTKMDGTEVKADYTGPIAAENKKPTIPEDGVTIVGNLTVESDLTATVSGATDEDGEDSSITYTYKWYRSIDNILQKEGDSADTAIDAKSDDPSKYTLVNDDRGNFIIVEVTPKDDKGLEGDPVTGVTTEKVPTS